MFRYQFEFQVYTSMGLEETDYSFFVKMLPSSHIHYNDRGKFILRKTGTFKREIESNFVYLKQLRNFVMEANKKHDVQTDFIAFPEVVYGSHDEAGNGVVVWMNETSGHGYQPSMGFSGLTLTELYCVVCRLAEYHASATAFLLHKNNDLSDFPFIRDGIKIQINENAEDPSDENSDSKLIFEMTQVFKEFSRFLRRIPGHLFAFKSFEKLRPSLAATLLRSFR